MEYRNNASGLVQFIIETDIPESWGIGFMWADENGVFDSKSNTVTFTAMVDFPVRGSNPSDDPFQTYSMTHIIDVSKIPDSAGNVNIVIQGKNGASGLQKTGTVTNSAPIIKR